MRRGSIDSNSGSGKGSGSGSGATSNSMANGNGAKVGLVKKLPARSEEIKLNLLEVVEKLCRKGYLDGSFGVFIDR